ncbi:MAG: Ig-like domain-containing protein [Candidatus Lokiarchaeota archaeon]|nr:Ig-like domain-containing protein [Candidatus Harpocratesius repetitus]
MKGYKKKIIGFGVGFAIVFSLFLAFSSNIVASSTQNVRSIRATQTTDTFTGAVARYEVDYFEITNVEPGLMELSVSWGNSYDIDCYICETADYTNYLARGYTTSNPETCSYNIQTAGTYYIAVRMYTWYASSTSYTATVKYYTGGTADTTAPTVSITAPSNGATVSETIAVTATASDNVGVSYTQMKIDSGSWTTDSTSPYSWSVDTTALSDGAHTITVQAFDAAGNYGEDSISITVDNTPSQTQLITREFNDAVAGYEVDYFELTDVEPGEMTVSVSWGNSYDIDCYICTTPDYTNYLARGYTTNNPETCSYVIQTAGTYYIAVRMYTSSASSTAYTATVSYYTNANGDYTAPTVSITAPADGDTVSGTITVTATASDNVGVSYTQMKIDSGSWTVDSTSPYSWSVDTTTLSEGSHTITVQAYDEAGNYGEDSISITVDNVPNTGGKYALIVGISDYKAINDLSYCDEDATDWYNYLISIGYESSNIIVLGDTNTANYPKYDGIATEYNIKYYLNWLADQSGEIAYITSGHGSGDGAGSSYICAWDCASGEDGEDGDLYDTEIAAILQTAIADDIFVFIDHCYSGGIGPDLMAMGNAAKVYCTTTCTENGYGYDDSTHQNGAWTYYFLEYTLINYYGSSATTAMEDAFAHAAADYPHTGGDAPMEFDGNTGSYFTL